MAAALSRGTGCLKVKLMGSSAEFKDSLEKVKTIPGRRFNSDDKSWELPDTPETLMQAVEILQPQLDAELKKEVHGAQAEVADDLVTRAGDDAKLLVPWASQLFPFQRAGVDFGCVHPHYINADDMGLGKTLQSITVVEEFYMRRIAKAQFPDDPTMLHTAVGADTYRTGPVLVICPNATREKPWYEEITKGPSNELFDSSLWPHLTATIIDAKKPADRWPQAKEAAERNDYLIINWEKLKLIPQLSSIKWAGVISDEAHRAKNRKSKQGVAMRKLKAPVQIAATGTPIMNSPDELWPLLNWGWPDEYRSYWKFFDMYVESYEGYNGSKIVTGVRNADALRFALRDKMIRRTKKQVLKDFPDKLPEQVIEVDMRPKQKRAYKAAQTDFLLDIEGAMEEADSEAAKRSILEILQSGDMDRIGREIPNAAARMSFMRQIATSPAVMDPDAPDESGKLDAVQEKINDSGGKQLVVAGHHKRAAETLAARLRRQKPPIECAVLNGDVNGDILEGEKLSDRQKAVDGFQNGEIQVLIAGISVGGVGITLTAADTIIFMEEDWVPSMNRQMEDRLYRIGQKNDVSVIKFRSKDTVDTLDIAPANALKKLIEKAVLGDKE